MRGIIQASSRNALVLFLVAAGIACATFQDLEILYRLPPASGVLKGTSLGLSVEDARESASILGAGAAAEFRNFPGDIAFSIMEPGAGAVRLGRYQVLNMVEEAFRRRLEGTGVSIYQGRQPGALDLVVVLRELSLDIVGNRWIARVRFQAQLMRNRRLLATQEISGEAERYHAMGRRPANQVASEMFTDALNRFDLQDLFRQAEKANPGTVGR